MGVFVNILESHLYQTYQEQENFHFIIAVYKIPKKAYKISVHKENLARTENKHKQHLQNLYLYLNKPT